MKKLMLVLALSLGFQSAFAAEAQSVQMNARGSSDAGAVIVGGIIGGIIGGVIGGAISDRDHGHRPVNFVCYARNRRGQVFRAFAHDERFARRQAMDNCMRNSFDCRPAGCQYN